MTRSEETRLSRAPLYRCGTGAAAHTATYSKFGLLIWAVRAAIDWMA